MKKTIIIALSAASSLIITSCGNKNAEQEPIVAPQGMHVLDLTKYGKSFAIFVPDTVQNKLTIIEQSYGALDISVGPNFAVSISEQAEDIVSKKKEISEDEVNKLKSFVTDEPTAILWESAITEPEFHFITNQKIGNSDYNIQDVRTTEGKPYSKEAIQKMFESAKNIKEIKKAEPET